MTYTKDLKDYLSKIRTDILPDSAIENFSLNRIGLYALNKKELIPIKESNIYSPKIYSHEKSKPELYGIRINNNSEIYVPTYIKSLNSTIGSSLQKIISNSVLNIYPTPLQAYGVITEEPDRASLGIASIDLCNLQDMQSKYDIESIRLDYLLHSLGLPIEIDSFYTFQKMIESGKLQEILTPRALVQLGLSSIFIPNAIGETDANSRNIILLKDKSTNKYDIVIRIDAEKNKNSFNSSNYKEDLVHKGIFNSYESIEDYLRIIRSKDTHIDWDLFSQFILIAKEMCSRSKIDNAITKSYFKNSGKLNLSSYQNFNPIANKYNDMAFFEFSDQIINHSNDLFSKILNALSIKINTPPFAESSKKYGNYFVDNSNPSPIIQKQFTKDGMIL